MSDLISRQALYEKAAEWEAQALHMVEVTMNDEDQTEWRKWSTVLTERSAFKFDVADAPSAERRGYWVGIDDYPHETWECDRCGHIVETDTPPKYCEECGARMEATK